MTRIATKTKVLSKTKSITDQETKVLTLICKELAPIQISSRLKISVKTFFNHRANIVSKIRAKGNIGLFKYALRNGYAKL